MYLVPKVISAPQSLEETMGEDVLLSCEVSGYPPPKIEWTLTKRDGNILPMPSNGGYIVVDLIDNEIMISGDDMRKSVQARGGPDQYQVTGWLQLQAIDDDDAGVYTCVGRNKLGKASADATLTVNRSK